MTSTLYTVDLVDDLTTKGVISHPLVETYFRHAIRWMTSRHAWCRWYVGIFRWEISIACIFGRYVVRVRYAEMTLAPYWTNNRYGFTSMKMHWIIGLTSIRTFNPSASVQTACPHKEGASTPAVGPRHPERRPCHPERRSRCQPLPMRITIDLLLKHRDATVATYKKKTDETLETSV
jgi:hypothetical protein